MENKKYEAVIGLEVHVELKTKSKMFCSCSADYFGQKPNTHTCPVCLGLPGALPVPNKTAIEWCIKIGLALNCEIPLFSKFDRKNYFYPDLPKGYQISQYNQPFCIEGKLEVNGKKIRIQRVHMEEDTGKLIHERGTSLIDFNRSGVHLVQIVTEPAFDNAGDVKAYLRKLQQIVRYLDVSNADMEKGDMRLEPNISLRKKGEKELPKYKVEVKNINSFKFVEKAIDYEIDRQREILESEKIPDQETRGWDENKQKTVTQRMKEEASDYRYFPEPDIPPFRFRKSQISNLKSQMPELPDQAILRFEKDYTLPHYDAEILTREKDLVAYFEEAVKASKGEVKPKEISNFIINKKIDLKQTLPAQLVALIKTSKKASDISDDELEKTVEKVIKINEKAVNDFKKGNENAIMFLIGAVMQSFKGKADARKIRAILIAKIKNG